MRRSLNQLSPMQGGLRLAPHKDISTQLPLSKMPLADTLTLSIMDKYGHLAKPLVSRGDTVIQGQIIACGLTSQTLSISAPASGIVEDIGFYDLPLRESSPCIKIKTNKQNHKINKAAIDYQISQPAFLKHLQMAGISGLGGANFPTYKKFISPIQTLIINAMECEPYISCDDMLIRTYCAEIMQGIDILKYQLHPKKIIIAIEDNKPEAIAQIKKNLRKDIHCTVLSSIYPSGSEKLLIQRLTKIEIARNEAPAKYGFLCLNIATVYSISCYFATSMGLVSRIITLTGHLKYPQNLEVPLGTPIKNLINQVGGLTREKQQILMGGPMMGVPVSENLPTTSACNALLILDQNSTTASPCIHCGFCIDVCPCRLYPNLMLQSSDPSLNFNECIECGCCNQVCPSHIPLAEQFKKTKQAINQRLEEKRQAKQAKQRQDFRDFRLARAKAEQRQAQLEKKAKLQKKNAK